MQLPVYNISGEVIRQIDVSDSLFAEPMNEAVVHQVMVAQRANARQGTASTKTRAEVRGTSHKMFRQKGTGNARAGSRRSPLRRGGGVAFGPKPRDYSQSLPKKMRRLAQRCLLSAGARDESLKIIENFGAMEPKTRQMAATLAALGAGGSILIVTEQPETKVIRSASNIPGVKTLPVAILNALDMLSHRQIIITESAVRRAETLWGAENTKGVDDASV